ncbi:MarR family winged helix-turn-helix transcriptional regulator [Halorubrum sp. DM2]|uniref:MarR family winged helix-turn-helix transcriptional regulator n=1 Tax=Halorubrum sp. DM2 TaxID=2527867 RepID=UPI0024B81CC9|nr:MarR family winged helix-turn-helix transcriptional regulator [Halorubrum sp. DM2]
MPELLASLREMTVESVQTYTSHTGPWRASAAILDDTIPEWNTLDDTWDDATAEAVAYTRAIGTLALTYDDEQDLSTYHDQRRASLVDTVESVGTGRGAVNANLGALAKGPVALHRELDDQPRSVTLLLDGPAWTKLTDRRTGVRVLAAIAVLANGFDVRVVATPRLQGELTRRYPQWSEVHLGLTADRDRSHPSGHRSSDETAGQPSPTQAAWAALDGLETEPGKRRLLGAIPQNSGCHYSELADDPTLDIERGTVGRYVLDLESRGLVTIDRRGRHNTVTLTTLGETAVSECLTAAGELQHPAQAQLSDRLTATTHDSSSTVSPPREATAPTPTTVEPWLAATGDVDEEYVRWIDTHDAAALHRRFTVPATTGAVTLVDDPVKPFDDGRVSYLSHVDGECLAIVEWGGPLATLGRLAGSLLSDQALDEILTPSRLGPEFANIHDGTGEFTTDPGRILRRGQQVGWFSDDEEAYTAWRDRIEIVRDDHLAQLSELVTSDDSAARGELFEDLHGLIATATQLYHAAGVDLTLTVRLPDTESLARDESRRADLCDFIRYTVPKQSVYGIHSGYRMLFEDRPPKLKRRLPYDVETGASMDLTASWVLAGPTATTLQADIAEALSAELGDLREAIESGTESAPTLTVPVRDGTTYASVRAVVDEIAAEYETEWLPSDRREIVRYCLQSFGRDVPHRSNPYDAVTCLVRACEESPTSGWRPAVDQAAATLPSKRFRPDLSPTATKLYTTLLTAPEPLGREALIDRADISASSYDRRIGTVGDLPRVRPTTVDGHRKWNAVIQTTGDDSPPSLQVSRRIPSNPRSIGNRSIASTVAIDFPIAAQLSSEQAVAVQATPRSGLRIHRHSRCQRRWSASWQLRGHSSRSQREPHAVPTVCPPISLRHDLRAPAAVILQTGSTTLGERSIAHTIVNQAATHHATND